jgi:kynurenine formamidase
MDKPRTIEELLEDHPTNWGRWGSRDEVGALNYLTSSEVLRGVAAVRSGKVFTLQAPVGVAEEDPVTPSRHSARRRQVADAGYWHDGRREELPGRARFADDYLEIFLQGTSQYDALGHAWCGDRIWNGDSEDVTIGGLARSSVLPIAERGIVGRGILLDMARFAGQDVLGKRDTFTHEDLLACARAQGTEIAKRDILVVRTGVIGSYFQRSREEFYAEFSEPGLVYSRELVDWFHEWEIPNLVTDTMGNEITFDPATGFKLLLHCALMRNLGISMCELTMLDDLATDCATDRQYTFLYTAAPLKIAAASGSPVNPVVIK